MLLAGALSLDGTPTAARTLMVGAGQEYARPGEAARAAAEGDHIRILAGTYYDCAVWTADRLVIEGAGPETVLTDTACQGKASFVVTGHGVTVRDLTFARIRVPDGNGAGLRAEGPDLLVERVRFDDDQDGILAAAQPGGTLRVVDCRFTATGVAGSANVTAALIIGPMAQLDVGGTVFEAARSDVAIVSDAAMTVIGGSQILGASLQVAGGLLLQDTTLQAGTAAAVLALPSADPAAPLVLRHNTLAGGGTLLLNWSGRPAVLEANTLAPGATLLSTTGAWSYRARRSAREAYAGVRGAVHALVHHALAWARGP